MRRRAQRSGEDASGRFRYLDLLRVVAITAVVVGHWLLTDVTYSGGQFSGLDSLTLISWARWATLVFQVMPVFFLVGGYVNARSWTRHHAAGLGWTDWVRARVMRLLWPTAVYVAVAVAAIVAARTGGAGAGELARIGWLVALQLWFLPVYLLLIALTPAMYAAHARWGAAVPAGMAFGVVLVDLAVLGPHLPLIGFANYLLVWGAIHQCGFLWADGVLDRAPWRPYAMALGGAVVLVGLLAWGPFPVDMIGAGRHVGNTSPPSIALLAFAATQIGLVVAFEPYATRLLERPRWATPVARLNPAVMTVYLWHMVPVVVVAVVLYPTGLMPQPDVGTAEWWLLRPVWIVTLGAVLVAVTVGVMRLERPMLRLPTGITDRRRWSPILVGLGALAAMVALARFAIGGFDPDGRTPTVALVIFTCGLGLTLASGRPRESDPAGTPPPARPSASASPPA